MKKQILNLLTLLALLFTAACSVSTGNSSTNTTTAASGTEEALNAA